MAKKLFIGGLLFTVTADDLKAAFSKAGAVLSAIVPTNKETGRTRGFGFVEMADEAGAQAAIDMFNGKTYEGLSFGDRGLLVNEARPMEQRTGGRGGFGGDRPRMDRNSRWSE